MPKYDRPPAFLLNADDFFSDGNVELMTNEEIGAYFRLCGKAWREKKCGSLPDDDDVLRTWSKMTRAKWARAKPRIMRCFKMGRDRRWHQKRLEAEFRKFTERKKVRATSASNAANARWRSHNDEQPGTLQNKPNGCETHANGNADAMRMDATKRQTKRQLNNTDVRATETSGQTAASAELNRRLAGDRGPHKDLDSETADQFLRTVRIVRVAKQEPQRRKDLDAIAKASLLAKMIYGWHWLIDSVEAVRIQDPQNRVAYLMATLKSKAKAMGRNFNQDLFKTSVPIGMLAIADEPEPQREAAG